MAKIAEERKLASRLREAIGFCKQELQISAMIDLDLQYEERVNFEKCLTENYLMKRGMDYFGKRDLIYLDMYGTNDVRRLMSTNVQLD
jgi:hypothetical protein